MTGAMHLATAVLGAFSYDPQIRGAWIVALSVVILCGSVYLLLMTNTGARLGFLLALAGLTGWMALMGWIWVVYGIGLKGDPPTWHVEDVVTGGALGELSTVEAVADDFPQGWERLTAADVGEAQAAADAVLIPHTGGGGHGGEEAAPVAPEFAPVFESLEDYTFVAAYRTGGEDYFIPGGYLERSNGFFPGWFHAPHYAVVQVAPVIEAVDIGGAPPVPQADPTKPVTSVVMVRDLGSLRLPSFLLALSMTILFGVVCWRLHQRDKEIMARRAQPAVA